MEKKEFIHPDDAEALAKLQSIPILPSIMEKVFQYGFDEISWSENITTNLRLGPTQKPEIYKMLLSVCEKLQIPVPELYLSMSPIPNAWTSGYKKIYIVVTYGLIRRFSDEEIMAVIAHECGHILCDHVLYSSLANTLMEIGDSIADSWFGQIGSAALKPVRQALCSWQRASELSADRVACHITSSSTLVHVLAKLERIPPVLLNDFDYDAWIKQGEDYEKLRLGSSWSKIVRYLSSTDMDHPFSPVRAFEATQWEKYRTNRNLGMTAICPKCGTEVEYGWQFCRKCGTRVD